MLENNITTEKELIMDNETSVIASFSFVSENGNLAIKGVHNNNEITSFSGVSYKNSIFEILNGGVNKKICNFLIRAINNRTIERNYFRLYSELLENVINEDEFNKEIEEHEDDYVIQNNISPSREDIMLVLNISRDIKDIQSSEDLSSLFSFNSIEVDKLLTNK